MQSQWITKASDPLKSYSTPFLRSQDIQRYLDSTAPPKRGTNRTKPKKRRK